jgi:sec-independent protein translocase protein TatB
MFDVGFWELVILFGLGLLVLGPERMPRVANQLGRWVGQARNMARHLTSQIRDEIEPFESGFRSAEQNLRKDFSAKRPEPGQNTASSNAKSDDSKADATKSAEADNAEPVTTQSGDAAETADTAGEKRA